MHTQPLGQLMITETSPCVPEDAGLDKIQRPLYIYLAMYNIRRIKPIFL